MVWLSFHLLSTPHTSDPHCHHHQSCHQSLHSLSSERLHLYCKFRYCHKMFSGITSLQASGGSYCQCSCSQLVPYVCCVNWQQLSRTLGCKTFRPQLTKIASEASWHPRWRWRLCPLIFIATWRLVLQLLFFARRTTIAVWKPTFPTRRFLERASHLNFRGNRYVFAIFYLLAPWFIVVFWVITSMQTTLNFSFLSIHLTLMLTLLSYMLYNILRLG